jgi:peptide deformylase
MYKIVKAPAEILREETQLVDFSGEKLEKIISEMKVTMLAQRDPEGVGLAANQVNLPYKIFLARFDVKKNSPIHTFINPEIISHSDNLYPEKDDKHAPLEGCLSLPNYYGVVKRFKWVEVRFETIEGGNFFDRITKVEKFEDFPATVIQHELDHLKGKIFVERILEQKGPLYKTIGKDKKGKDRWEEVELLG